MIKDPDILKEMQEISPLVAGLREMNVFRVPDGYFEGVADDVMDTIKITGIHIGRKPVQEVPSGYFETLSDNIMQRIKAGSGEETEPQYPLLSTVGRQNVFSTPDGYFDKLPHTIFAKIKEGKEERTTKVIRMLPHKIWRYAAAAVLAAGIFITSYFVTGNQHPDANGFTAINKNTVPDPAALQFNSAKTFNEGIASLTDDEIVNYLEDHGNILDNDLLQDNTDDSELPDAADYFLNEQALTNYLDKINNKKEQSR